MAALLGRAYVISTENRFLDAYRAIRAELERRGAETAVAANSEAADTLVAFYSSLAADALVRTAAVGVAARGQYARG